MRMRMIEMVQCQYSPLFTNTEVNIKQLLDEVFVISGIIEVEVTYRLFTNL